MSTDDISPDQFATSLEELADSKDLPALRGYDAARRRALTAARRLHQRLETPLELSRRLGWQESAHVVAIKIAMDLGLFKVIQERDLSSNGGTSVRDLAEVSGGDEELVGRVMRHLATFEMVREMDVGLYAATATSDAFLDRKVYSGIDYWVYLSAPGMSYLPRFVREDGYANLSVPGKSNWEKASGTGKPFFAWLNDHPHALKTFTDHLNAFTDGRAGWIDTYPARERLVEGADTDGPLLVDVGGGVGRDVLMFQQRFAQPSGRLFVQDLPEVVSKAEDLDPAIEMQAHDFFSPQALCGARAFLLHYVLHDWPDDACLKILTHLKAAMRPEYSKLLIAEFVVASKDADPFNTALDLVMMTVVGSKERTEENWRSLIERAGLRIDGIWSLPGNHESVIEVVLA